jgi:uncharacterized protein YhaN
MVFQAIEGFLFAGSIQSAQAKLASLPLPIKLAHLQADIANTKATISEKAFDQQLADANAQLESAHQEWQRLSAEVAQLRKQRDKLSADSLVVTRLRLAHERHAELQAQVQYSLSACWLTCTLRI